MRTGRGPSRPRAGEAGFTLAELLISVLLGAMVLSGAAAIQQFAVTRQIDMIGRIRLDGQAVYSLEVVRSALQSASQVLVPADGTASTRLSLYQNVNPLDGSALVPPRPRRWVHVCLAETEPAALYRYWGDLPMPSIPCGLPATQGGFELLAGEPTRPSERAMNVAALFSRLSGARNVVEFQYGLGYPAVAGNTPATVRGVTRVHVQEALR